MENDKWESEFEMSTSYSWSQFENCIKELSPYVKERLVKAASREMSEIEWCMKESYNDDKEFGKLIDEVFGKYLDKVVPNNNNKRVAKKILDLDLWFLIHYQLKLRQKITIDRKFTGRLLEIVAESVLKAYLNREKLSYEFVDYDPVDYVIMRNNDAICEISCKTVLSTKNSNYDYKEHAKIVANRLQRKTNEFIVFCGCGEGEKKTIRDEFDKINSCKLFYLWAETGKKSSAYMLDESFYEFIKFIENL